jgi:hypothetical protein
MFNTNDVFNDARRDSVLQREENDNSVKSLVGSKVLGMLLLVGATYIGVNYYNSITILGKSLVVKNELVAAIQVQSELEVVERSSSLELRNSELDYLIALKEIESELIEEVEVVNLDTREQMHLSSSMTDIMDDELLVDNTKYTKALRKEIGVEVNKVEKSFSTVMSDFDDVIPRTNLNYTEDFNREINADVNNKVEVSLSLAMSELMDDTEITEEVSKDARVVIVKKGDTLRGISDKFYGDALNYKRIIASNDSLNANDTIYVGQTILLPY